MTPAEMRLGGGRRTFLSVLVDGLPSPPPGRLSISQLVAAVSFGRATPAMLNATIRENIMTVSSRLLLTTVAGAAMLGLGAVAVAQQTPPPPAPAPSPTPTPTPTPDQPTPKPN